MIISDKKRIELHCHSKVGGDSSMYPGEIVKYLSDKGMPAFAITDTSNVNAFPELEKVWKTGNYTARPIYGMEVLLEEDADGSFGNVSVLVKDEIGKKTLYKMISENKGVSPFLQFSFETLLEHREGLLLGSGNEKGRVYHLADLGADDEALKEEMKHFDYIELLPYAELKDINIRLVRLCDELGIPAVAISNARFSDEIGQMALQVMRHWKKEEETSIDNHFMSDEEMLQAFDYLPEEKAFEIVVENTHLIAKMCETCDSCPKEMYIPKIPEAKGRLREICISRLLEIYPDRPDVQERLDWELAALEKTEMESYLLQVKELMDISGFKVSDLSSRGAAGGSLVVFLLGISEADPIKYGLEPEFVFGADGSRRIDIDINFPEEGQLDVIHYVGELEGIGQFLRVGYNRQIKNPEAEMMVERYVMDKGLQLDEEGRAALQWKISGNYVGRAKHPGGVLMIPEGVNIEEILPVVRLEDGTEVTGFDYYSFDDAFIKTDLLKLQMLDRLRRLSQYTGIDLADVPVDSKEALALFQADSNGEVTGCSDLPFFESEYVREVLAILKPESFSDLVKIRAILHGTNSWEENGKLLVKIKDLGIRDIIATRDDIFEYILALGLDRKTSYEIAEAVRKGVVSRGKNAQWQKWKKLLLDSGAPEWYVWSCEQIRYLFPRAHAISYTMMSMRMAWFKVHYPKAFQCVQIEFTEKK